MPRNGEPHRQTLAGIRDPLVPLCTECVRALMSFAKLSNRQVAAALTDQGVPVAAQTLDYLMSDPPKQKRARRSLVAGLARMGAVPMDWLTGERRALIQGSSRSPIEQLTTYRWMNDVDKAVQALVRDAPGKPRHVGRHATVLTALTSPEQWRQWLFVNPPPLDASEEGELAVHLATTFRLLLAPWLAGEARINPAALDNLAEAWGLDVGSTISMPDMTPPSRTKRKS